ncbi:hypothetical protein M885DRAFT_563326 [Pelagophyceae sp. CCMP2097]|nr:hypothetical protein M885DRAFT_563326 [Pelagophyceae sp. CCMP2097]
MVARKGGVAKRKGGLAVALKKYAVQAAQLARPVVYYGFVPVVILVGMLTEPRPAFVDLFTIT